MQSWSQLDEESSSDDDEPLPRQRRRGRVMQVVEMPAAPDAVQYSLAWFRGLTAPGGGLAGQLVEFLNVRKQAVRENTPSG